jgi:hypothetical protein
MTKPQPTKLFLMNLLIFKLSWLLLVVGQDNGLVPAIFLFIINVILLPQKKNLWKVCSIIFLGGICLDSFWVYVGIIQFSNDWLPSWLIMLWLVFSLNLPQWLNKLEPTFNKPIGIVVVPLIGGLLGFIGYGAAWFLGVLNPGYSVIITLAAITTAWAFLFPLLRLSLP